MCHFRTVESHGFRFSCTPFGFDVTELFNAGKRGKACRFFWADTHPAHSAEDRAAFADLAWKVEAAVTEGTTADAIGALFMASPIPMGARDLRGVDVRPAGFPTVDAADNGNGVRITSGWDGFTIADAHDPNDTRAIPKSDDRRSVARARAWIPANLDKLQGLTFWKVVSTLRDAGIDCHTFCALN